ncbi:MAG: hypothetical protein RR034_08275, partial [Bacteroidales bacterium]
FNSAYIRMATLSGIIMLALNIGRASFIRHPFIALETWKFKMVYLTFFLYILIDLLLAPSHLLEHIYIKTILGYDALNVVSLNWMVLAGIVAGSFFAYQTFALRKWPYKSITVIAFSTIVLYLILFYFIIDQHLPKESLMLPLFLRGFGYVIIAICFITALVRVPFQYFFQAVSIQAFVSAGFGSVLGTALLGQALKITVKKNTMLLGTTLDHVNPLAQQLSFSELYETLQQQALMVSMKELYGWLSLIGIACLLIFIITESSIRPKQVLHPTYKAIRRLIKREMGTKTE